MEDFKTFKDIEYKRPDIKIIKKQINDCCKAMKNAVDYPSFKKEYKNFEETFKEVYSMMTISSIRNTLDKTNEYYENEEKFMSKAGASLSLASLKLTDVILQSKYKENLKKDYGEILIKGLEMSKKLMSKKILLLVVKESNLCQKYSKDAAMCKTIFRGEECNFYGLLKHMQSTDRNERKEAFEAWANLYESVSTKLDDTYDKLIDVRCKIARKLNFNSYTDYAYLSRSRYDYTKEDVEKFRNEVKEYIVPLCEKLYAKQEKDLDIDKLHIYDEELTFKEGNAVPIGTKDELVEKARVMYNAMSKETGEYFNFMTEHELFDLDTRPGKHLGGYCTFIPKYLAPFIFSNFNGTSQDVDVLTHEAGHAFEAYLAARNVELLDQMSSTSEINEIHSMTMEHFAYPYMDSFFGEEANKYKYHHLCKAVETIPYLVSVDEFQHKVYENPKMSAMDRRKVWHDIELKYLPWRDYDGNEFLGNGGFWMQKQHIFLYPFYYVDYALAQICAFQLFIRDLDNHETAWKDYLNLCMAGGTKGYFELLDVAKLENPFKKGTVKNVAEEISKVIDSFEKNIAK